MGKLGTIVALEENPAVKVVGRHSLTNLSWTADQGLFFEEITFVVAPKTGLYTAGELEQFMMGLVPLQPTGKQDFVKRTRAVNLGRLYFDEEVGNPVSEEDIVFYKTAYGWKVKPGEIPKRRVWIRVYPDANIAREAMRGKIATNVITDDELEKAQLAPA